MAEFKKVMRHSHSGTDSEKIDPRNLLGFPVYNTIPTFVAKQGTVIIYDNQSDTRQWYAFLDGVWQPLIKS